MLLDGELNFVRSLVLFGDVVVDVDVDVELLFDVGFGDFDFCWVVLDGDVVVDAGLLLVGVNSFCSPSIRVSMYSMLKMLIVMMVVV